MLRPEFVHRKLRLVTDDLTLLARFRDTSHDALVADPLASVERLLERIVMRAVDVNRHLLVALGGGDRSARLGYRDTFTGLGPLGVLPEAFATDVSRSAGLRNVLAHDYTDADRTLVHAAIGLCLSQYPRYVDRVAAFVDAHA